MVSGALAASHATAAALLGWNRHGRGVSAVRSRRCVVVTSAAGGDPAGRRGNDGSEASTSSGPTIPSRPSRGRKKRAAASKPRNAIATGSGEWDSDDDLPSDGALNAAPPKADRADTTTRARAKPRGKNGTKEETELVMVLERRGEGWNEEVFPHVVMKRRPVPQRTQTATRSVKADDAALFLEELGFEKDDAVATISAAAAWRVTPRGRALVDKKMMRAVQSNTRNAVECLRQVGANDGDIPKLIREVPQILAVVPNNEWNRRLLEYVVRTKVSGGGRLGPLKLSNRGRLPKENKKNEEMKPWVNEVRELRRFGRLSQEQMYMLDVAGFDANVKETKRIGESRRTWEMWFDELVEYQCKQGTVNIPTERADAGLGLWLKRQKEKHAVGKLGAKALKRLVAVGVNFDGYHPTSQLELTNPGKPKRGRPRKKQNGADTVTPSNAAEAGVSFEVGTESRVDFTVEGALLGASERMKDWRYVLGDEGCEYVYELKRWKQTEGEFIEPPLGSPLAVWLAKQRARAATADGDEGGSELLTPMPEYEREALVNAGIELENFSPTWLGELEKFHGLRQHRVTLHDPIAQRVFVEEQRQQSAEGKLSRAKLRRLKGGGRVGHLRRAAARRCHHGLHRRARRRGVRALAPRRHVPKRGHRGHLAVADARERRRGAGFGGGEGGGEAHEGNSKGEEAFEPRARAAATFGAHRTRPCRRAEGGGGGRRREGGRGAGGFIRRVREGEDLSKECIVRVLFRIVSLHRSHRELSSHPAAERGRDASVVAARVAAARVPRVVGVLVEYRVHVQPALLDNLVELIRLVAHPPADEYGEEVEVDRAEADDEEPEHGGHGDGDVRGGAHRHAAQEHAADHDPSAVQRVRRAKQIEEEQAQIDDDGVPAQVLEEHAAVGERCVAVRGRGEEDDPHDHLRDVGEGTRDGDEEVLLRLSRVTDEGEPTERPEQDTFHRAPDPIRRPAVAELVDEDGAEQNRAVHEENHEAVLRATLQSALNKAQKRHHGDVNQEEPVDAQRDAEERAARVGSIHEAITLTQCGLLTLRGALRRGSGVVSAHRAREE